MYGTYLCEKDPQIWVGADIPRFKQALTFVKEQHRIVYLSLPEQESQQVLECHVGGGRA